MGAAYGTAKSGIGIAGVGTFRPDLIMKCLIPVVMSGIIAVYSLVISVLIAQDLQPPASGSYSLFKCVEKLLLAMVSDACADMSKVVSCILLAAWPLASPALQLATALALLVIRE
jgi:vacuolar ATP synthase 16 kDa proteolipid subunit